MKILIISFALAVSAWAQITQIPNTGGGGVTTGATLPATCTPSGSNLYFLTTGTVGLYQCLTTDTWTFSGGGSGSVTSAVIAGTSRKISVSGTCTITTTGTCTLTLPADLLLPLSTAFTAGTTGGPSFNIPSGVAPTSPASGDFWNLSGVMQFYDGAATQFVVSSKAWTINTLKKGGGNGAAPIVTGITVDSSDNLSSPGSASFGAGSGVAGIAWSTQGTAPSLLANSWGWYAGAAAPAGGAAYVFPATATTGALLATCSAGVCTISHVALGTGVQTWLATPSSANLAAALTDETGSGAAVFANTPTLVTPVLGVATATSINGLTVTSSTGTLTVPNGVTLTGPAASGTAMALNQANTGTSAQTIDISAATGSNAFKVPVKAGVTTSANGAIGYDSTRDMITGGQASATADIPTTTATPANGDCANWVVSGTKYKLGTAGAGCGSGGSAAGASLFSATASATVTATSATTLIGSVTGSTTVPANTFTAGQPLQIIASGYYSTPATPASLTIDLLVGGTIRITTGAVVQIASVTNGVWRLNCMLTTRTAGASGTQIANCIFEGTGSTLTAGEAPLQTSSTWTIDTTATKVLDIQATWSTATGSPTITATNIAAWIPGAPVTSVFGQTGAVAAPAALGSSTATTQSAADNSTKVATTAYADAAAAARSKQLTLPFGCAVGDPAGSALATGVLCYVVVPVSGTITGWDIVTDAGTATVDVWKIATGTAKPTVTNTITASAKPAISTGTAIHSTTLTSWTTSVSANDILGFNLDTVATAKYITIAVQVQF